MKQITYTHAREFVLAANTMSYEEIQKLQKERLSELVKHARKNSVFYREKYSHLGENPDLEDLPIVTKKELSLNMNNWICDKNFSEEALNTYLSDINNIEQPFLGKYSVITTSGTTGVPLKLLRDSRHIAINNAIMDVRHQNGKVLAGVFELKKKNTKYASILAMGGFHAAYTSFEKAKKLLEKEEIYNVMELLPIGEPVSSMVDKLNAYQPEIITGYPSVIEILSCEQDEGRLNIAPKAIICSAEQLTEHTRNLLSQRFKCPVSNIFCSSEGGEIALICEKGHMHANVDWIIIEPIDKDGNPVKDGEMSDAVLVTNLANAVQPIIRYWVDDCVIMHHEQCSCGLPFPYIEILGRTDDIPEFEVKGRKLRLSPFAFSSVVYDIEGIAAYQLAQTSPTSLAMRVVYFDNADIETVNKKIENSIGSILKENELLNVSFKILNEEPKRAEKGKKMRAIVKEF